jgi:hypothetical protein
METLPCESIIIDSFPQAVPWSGPNELRTCSKITGHRGKLAITGSLTLRLRVCPVIFAASTL